MALWKSGIAFEHTYIAVSSISTSFSLDYQIFPYNRYIPSLSGKASTVCDRLNPSDPVNNVVHCWSLCWLR